MAYNLRSLQKGEISDSEVEGKMILVSGSLLLGGGGSENVPKVRDSIYGWSLIF